ncbi:hypothetical protein M5K25_003880 [Dendrobium thyrsiflorum]|uniref:Uncharacterized protein n=1 Tax=Dendrobium thyrsiflorum TaxID=117978 RepID=A0ABD0VLA2_DENTH
MAAKKVDALEERLEGEMNQIKTTVKERMSSMEGQVADLRDMIKKMLEVHNQTTASVARSGEGRSTNSEIRREEEEAEIMEGERRRPHLEPVQREERGGGYGGYQGHRLLANSSIPSGYLRTQVFPISQRLSEASDEKRKDYNLEADNSDTSNFQGSGDENIALMTKTVQKFSKEKIEKA